MRTVFNRYLGRLLMVAALVFLPCALLAWWLGPIAGDLVRLGPWSERDFGWTAPQPRLAVQANGRSQTDPAVLVLGEIVRARRGTAVLVGFLGVLVIVIVWIMILTVTSSDAHFWHGADANHDDTDGWRSWHT